MIYTTIYAINYKRELIHLTEVLHVDTFILRIREWVLVIFSRYLLKDVPLELAQVSLIKKHRNGSILFTAFIMHSY